MKSKLYLPVALTPSVKICKFGNKIIYYNFPNVVSLQKIQAMVLAGGVQRGQILRKLPQFSARNLQKLRKLAEACGSPAENSAYRSLRKLAEACGSLAEALRKPCGSLAEALRKHAEALRKPCGSMRKPCGRLRKFQLRKHAEALRKLCGSPVEALRKHAEALRKPCGSPTEISQKLKK